MSNTKYADLPDIDTAPDIYETDDVFPSSQPIKGDESDDDAAAPSRSAPRGRNNELSNREELDVTSLIATDEATKKFRKAEKRRDRQRTHYAYPPSPSSPSSPNGQSPAPRSAPLSHRLRALQAELSALEQELADPSNPLIQKEREEENVDPGELIRGLVDVRARLEKIKKGKEGRGRLVGVVLGDDTHDADEPKESAQPSIEKSSKVDELEVKSETHSIIEMDKRVGELEKLVGSSRTALDETSPLPSPLLPLINRLNNQLTLLTQPRHIDSVSRRLKLLLSDLDRASASQHHSHRKQSSQPNSMPQHSQIQEQLLPLLSRLGPSLPHIPHILTRLRTLSTLHTSASEFQGTLQDLEQEQQKMRESLLELEDAVQKVEKSLDENRSVVKGNVAGLEGRVDALLGRLEELGRGGHI
ncbi:Dynamitin-domain-containing protein [Crucibulum laeve]|uniref:Dynamitin-domain-containing protein n=1 Tax=Crucibulum laeve TaxID=68775 RepID=A0A5C3MI20_9AGAR|nr:Dynamitin-domain-containing protein [Crucibulum laeve]